MAVCECVAAWDFETPLLLFRQKATRDDDNVGRCTYEHIADRVYMHIPNRDNNKPYMICNTAQSIFTVTRCMRNREKCAFGNEMLRAAVARMEHVHAVVWVKTIDGYLGNKCVRTACENIRFLRLHTLRGVISILWANGFFVRVFIISFTDRNGVSARIILAKRICGTKDWMERDGVPIAMKQKCVFSA